MTHLTLNVMKRDGRVVAFDENKMFVAVSRAFTTVYPGVDVNHYATDIMGMVQNVVDEIRDMELESIGIEDIQTLLLSELLASDFPEVGVHYTEYRVNKQKNRIKQSDIERQLRKLIARDERVIHENANKDANVFNTQRDLTAGISAKSIGLRMLPTAVANAHEKGDIHYHDLDYHPYTPMTNCCLIDFDYLFTHGFHLGNAEVERPKSIQTAVAQVAQVIANVSSSQFGGTSVDRVDELLAPFAQLNYDKHLAEAAAFVIPEKREAYAMKKTQKDIFDAMQSLEYEVNTLYTSNGQTPFVTFGFGLGTSVFERAIQMAILQNRINGLGKEKRTAIFPKLVFGIKKGLNLNVGDPNYDVKQLAITCATKRMYPDILNYDKLVELTGSYKAPMGCRSFLQAWQDENGKDVTSGRMNLGVVTVNLPRIALEARGDQVAFWSLFEERVAIAREALLYRVSRTKEAQPENAPILYKEGAFGHKLTANQSVNEVFKNKRATVSLGYIGLYEVATAFYGPNWETNPEAKAFTLAIVSRMKEHCDTWGDLYGYHFSVYATPSESLTDRFCRMDTERFGRVPDITDKEYYTNSFHYDVRKNPTPFEKLDFEKDYPQYCSGGFIHYAEYPNIQQNPKALEAVWDYSYDKVAYLGTNAPIDKCYDCGFAGEFHPTARGFECPACHNHNPDRCDVVKRTCGYLGNPQKRPMAKGRHKEIVARKKHM